MRLVAYNVSGGPDALAAGQLLARLAPDVVCLTEIPAMGRFKALARFAGLEVVARAGRRGTGTAILASEGVRVRATNLVPLSTPRDVPSRQATHAILSVAGLGVSVTAVQFGLRPEVRRTNLEEMLTFLATIEQPSVIGADLNESVRSPVAAALSERFQDAHAVAGTGAGLTYPTVDPSTRQDFVFVSRRLEVRSVMTPADGSVAQASHHLPVVVELGPGPGARPTTEEAAT